MSLDRVQRPCKSRARHPLSLVGGTPTSRGLIPIRGIRVAESLTEEHVRETADLERIVEVLESRPDLA